MKHRADKIRVLIVDDEPLARRRIAALLKDDAEIEVIGSAASGPEALRMTEKEDVDIIFLDVQMPKMNGFEFLDALNKRSSETVVVFVTAFDDHAIRAFEAQAIDYLLKPYDEERFQKALSRAKKQVDKRTAPAKPLQRIAVKVADKSLLLKSDEIDWIEAEGKYARLHVGGSSYLRREPLRELEAQLDKEVFVRIHRSTLVNIDRIREIHPLFHGDVQALLRDGTKLTVSRRYRSKLQALVGMV